MGRQEALKPSGEQSRRGGYVFRGDVDGVQDFHPAQQQAPGQNNKSRKQENVEGGEGKRWDLCEEKDTEEAVPRDFFVTLTAAAPCAAGTQIKIHKKKKQKKKHTVWLKVVF